MIINTVSESSGSKTKYPEFEYSNYSMVVNQDSSITETYDNDTITSVFGTNTITQTLRENGVVAKTKTVTFNQDGSVTEVVV